MKHLLFSLVVLLTITSCKKEESVDQPKIDEDIIAQYIADNNLDATATGTGLYYVIDSVGAGAKPSSQSTVTVAYKGYLTDGSVFDESSASGATFGLNSVIEGWKEGIPLYSVGGSGILLIPSALGYGGQSQGDIPANSVLIFEVSLIDFR
ncbi:MAG: FKBP-type peptidyl-prolyl cis-trans isomerase [Flavobacteriales bacterium]|nr:FKBP-type peptidyl-prolyl cis-trans isomerase [Flavobacteriales bacterium]